MHDPALRRFASPKKMAYNSRWQVNPRKIGCGLTVVQARSQYFGSLAGKDVEP
jgi:hypothetical protein